MIGEKFIYTNKIKWNIITAFILGLVIFSLGIFTCSSNFDLYDVHGFNWMERLSSNLWINNVYFIEISVIGVFFVSLQYVTKSGWSAGIKRIPEAFGYWLPYGFTLMLCVFLLGSSHIFHWTHGYLYDPSHDLYDQIIVGKEPYLNYPFYITRMFIYFIIWYSFFRLIRKESLLEDTNGGVSHYNNMVKYSAFFIILFGITSSTSAWDWILSIDTHWFSTMIGWYVFVSSFVAGLSFITLFVVFLKDQGYLSKINHEHFHDLGKFVFAFSVFWGYIWFSQFMLIYYANIPEETIYFLERLQSSNYMPLFFLNLAINFFFPFLGLMARNTKRYSIFLKIVCIVLLCGHWLDFYLMVTPGVLSEYGDFGLIEIGSTLIYASSFIHVVLSNLSYVPLVSKKHPLIWESINHHT